MSDSPPLSASEVERLRALAEKATPLWSARERGHGIMREFEIVQAGGGILFRSTSYGRMEADAAFIGMASPATVLALIDELKRLSKVDELLTNVEAESQHYQAETVRLRDALAAAEKNNRAIHAVLLNAEKERDAMRAALEKIATEEFAGSCRERARRALAGGKKEGDK